ncbi:MAG TPA: hypothetical protein VFO67_10295 [Gemmatimonadales bacterium]|nr:hypothetical protein [Gemmatimonadales bacterium]
MRHRLRHPYLLGSLALLALSVACRLDMLLKPTNLPRPVLTVTPTAIEDTARAHSNETRQAHVAITNDGGGTFTWTASDRSAWIRLEPSEGDVPGTLTITLDPDDLGPGTYEADVTVTARSAADTQVTIIPVTFVVQRPGLNVSPTTITRSTSLGSGAVFNETIQIINSGTGRLDWIASEDRSWLSLNATSGNGDASLGVTINSAGLERGTYTEDIVISAPGALGSPAHVSVTLTVLAPGLAVSPSSIGDTVPAGTTAPSTRTLRVTNSGNGSVTWTASKTQPWVGLSKTAGGAPEDVVVTLDPNGLPPGIYSDTIVFTSPEATNGSVKVPVTFGITQPGLNVSPPSISATAEERANDQQDFDLAISNSGGGTLAWFAGADASWISLSPLAGLAPSTLRVRVDPRGLAAGTYTGQVTVSAPGAVGSPVVVPVQLTITKKGCNEDSLDPDVVRTGTLSASDCDAPHRPGSFANLYGFNASAGDVISIRMTAEFNAYLIFTDGAGNVLAQNDECPGEFGTACIMDYPINSSGHYLIEATSTAPGAAGQLTLTLIRERAPSEARELRQLRNDGSTQIGVGETIPETEVVIRGKVDDPNATQTVRFEVELRPLSQPFSGAPTQISDFAPRGSTISVRASNLATGTGFHWQARACDVTGRCGTWTQFGNNAESAADFNVATPGGSPPRKQ